ncbi:electron transfer flavoprotein subunit alpha/FixB family protein [Ignavibacteria bacterium]|nr:electron transfer flavoprotein subunit alpha/FixB family protein [Bacteroidota bacterium]MCZ2132862.1 electron transfer flavoprotein subunit alpha/FixB family protein [Bacteroidota bacterium]
MSTILVYLESQGNGLKRSSLEAITAAVDTGYTVIGLLADGKEENVQAAAEYGLTKCLLAKHPLLAEKSSPVAASAIAQAARYSQANYVMASANSNGKEIAPRVAVKLQAGYIPDAISLESSAGSIIAKRPAYAGKAIVSVQISTQVGVITLRPNVFTAKKRSASLTVEEFSPEITTEDIRARVTGVSKNEGRLDVSEADIIVSGGRGLKAAENYNLIESLAQVLGGAVGSSRAVVDAGWRPHSEQIGQTGKTVSPSLYFACGISGAIQHLAGMSTSKIIVAINKDKDAPIFKVADYGIVGDILEVLPKLTEALRRTLNK